MMAGIFVTNVHSSLSTRAAPLRINYPVVLGTQETNALFDESETLLLTIIIDCKGNVRDRVEGILLPKEFEQKIKPLRK